jgi:hypothetical protein
MPSTSFPDAFHIDPRCCPHRLPISNSLIFSNFFIISSKDGFRATNLILTDSVFRLIWSGLFAIAAEIDRATRSLIRGKFPSPPSGISRRAVGPVHRNGSREGETDETAPEKAGHPSAIRPCRRSFSRKPRAADIR